MKIIFYLNSWEYFIRMLGTSTLWDELRWKWGNLLNLANDSYNTTCFKEEAIANSRDLLIKK